MGKITLILVAIILIAGSAMITIPSSAMAEGGNFGLGIIVGEPTGFVGKLFLSSRNAIDFALAWSLDDNNYMHVHGDYLFHNFFLLEDVEGEFAWYLGIGGRVVLVDDHDDHVGVRFPVGLTYLFANTRFDAFLELVPIMDVAPDTDFDLEGAIGGRFYF
ncbi:MAG: hypothetical protein KAV42_02910 [Candidatus Krumholzibacteria bacterium]|nr:hypothetical protein [Candidatus Krumholzibacteria bacterium]